MKYDKYLELDILETQQIDLLSLIPMIHLMNSSSATISPPFHQPQIVHYLNYLSKKNVVFVAVGHNGDVQLCKCNLMYLYTFGDLVSALSPLAATDTTWWLILITFSEDLKIAKRVLWQFLAVCLLLLFRTHQLVGNPLLLCLLRALVFISLLYFI